MINRGMRLLAIYEKLQQTTDKRKKYVRKHDLVTQFGVNEKTIQRDINELRAFFAEPYALTYGTDLKYSKSGDGYYIEQPNETNLVCEEVLALCKVLLESRAFCKEELNTLVAKLLATLPDEDSKLVKDLILNEHHNYVALKHGKKLLPILWDFSKAMASTTTLEITYNRMDGNAKKHLANPVGIMFSEFYFYLIAYLVDSPKDFPTIFRFDRVTNYRLTNDVFRVPYKDKFNEGEFRKRIQFMYSGPLKRIRFIYTGPSLEAVLDRLPTASVIAQTNDSYTLSAEVYGDGVDIWLRSQGDYVTVLS